MVRCSSGIHTLRQYTVQYHPKNSTDLLSRYLSLAYPAGELVIIPWTASYPEARCPLRRGIASARVSGEVFRFTCSRRNMQPAHLRSLGTEMGCDRTRADYSRLWACVVDPEDLKHEVLASLVTLTPLSELSSMDRARRDGGTFLAASVWCWCGDSALR